ncbi:MAG TPA: glycoside hydrolase domain-containing protein [Thermoanaerobaculia bacterium]|nr:glycoside hydrolase domain-containing protein [Thermoanaerobaculia bacterium]
MGDIVTGVDASSACTSSTITCLQSEGISFVGRYYSRTTHIEGKKLTQSEAALLSAARLQIVTVYEDGPTSYSYFSASRGTADAGGAIEQAEAIGQPKGSAIYFTVDYDAAPDEITGNITAYFEAIAAALNGTYVVGVYGSGAVCTAITEAGYAHFAWLAQSTGWSGYSQFNTWAIKQGPEQPICGLNSDSDVANGEFGAFTV